MCGEKNSEKISEFRMGIGPMALQTLIRCSNHITELLRTLVMRRSFEGQHNDSITQSHMIINNLESNMAI